MLANLEPVTPNLERMLANLERMLANLEPVTPNLELEPLTATPERAQASRRGLRDHRSQFTPTSRHRHMENPSAYSKEKSIASGNELPQDPHEATNCTDRAAIQ
ncbi:hypothetical protein ACGFX7_24175 [Streptomyces harbinensis]|uniref:hypothetical protein n=1 Tax=Streptomyces harbinensis TaxID=1176198 RepID=UPI00371AB1FB